MRVGDDAHSELFDRRLFAPVVFVDRENNLAAAVPIPLGPLDIVWTGKIPPVSATTTPVAALSGSSSQNTDVPTVPSPPELR